jgi:serine/threonine protein kinase
MQTKRKISGSEFSTVEEKIKRLAISIDGRPMALSIHNRLESNGHVMTVMSNARDDFASRYDILREIGKGGFSTVYQCRRKDTGVDYAVKVSSRHFYFSSLKKLVSLL